jgi:hypothetical protein
MLKCKMLVISDQDLCVYRNILPEDWFPILSTKNGSYFPFSLNRINSRYMLNNKFAAYLYTCTMRYTVYSMIQPIISQGVRFEAFPRLLLARKKSSLWNLMFYGILLSLGWISLTCLAVPAYVAKKYTYSCCIALGWRFVDWPLPIAATRTMTRNKNKTGGSRVQKEIIEERIGPKNCLVNRRTSTPFPGRAGEKVQGAVLSTEPPPPPTLWAAWAGIHYPPPQSYPLPQETIIWD